MKFLPKEAQAELAEILPQEEIFRPSSDTYIKESKVWAAQKQGNPAVVLRPSNATRLQKLVPYLYGSGLDFAIRCGGMGSSSAQDVVLKFGLAADPQNMLDVEIVLRDGRKVWASNEPDLLWALRGGGGNFGGQTPSAHKQPTDGQEETANFHLSLFIFDAYGEDHGRSAEGFKWAFEIPGAVDSTTVTNLKGVNAMQGGHEHLIGAMNSYLNACLVHDVDPEFVVRGKKWVDSVVELDERLGPGTLFLFEVMPGRTFHATGSSQETAWPHSSASHILQLLTGSLPGSGCPEALALEALGKAPLMIKESHSKADFFPNFLEPVNDRSAIFGDNYPKLQQLKKQYDPEARFDKGSFIPPE
ncbi:hypothetical protein SLS57_002599 [Botryosphaeria dothidea]